MLNIPYRLMPLAIAVASTAILLAAYGFEYLGGFLPCVLCLGQRIPHWIVIGIASLGTIAAFSSAYRVASLSMAGTALTYAYGLKLAIFHVGVEHKWWPGPAQCSRPGLEISMDIEALFTTELVRCDTPEWLFLGQSMATYNAALCLGLALISAAFAWKLWTRD